MAAGPQIKHDWYQTGNDVVITILAKNLSKDDVTVTITSTSVSVSAKLPSDQQYQLQLQLSHPVLPEHSSWRILASKIEVRLRKAEGHQWATLEGDGRPPMLRLGAGGTASAGTGSSRPPPVHRRDWDAFATEIKKQEESEQPEGEEALNKMFQKIYAEGSDEVRKAMVKSFTESGGTVLSTNWKDIGAKKVDVRPPDGMEFKKWDE